MPAAPKILSFTWIVATFHAFFWPFTGPGTATSVGSGSTSTTYPMTTAFIPDGTTGADPFTPLPVAPVLLAGTVTWPAARVPNANPAVAITKRK